MALILLPSPPTVISHELISVTYLPLLTQAISPLRDISGTIELLVAVDWPVLYGRLGVPRTELFNETQKFLGYLYVLIYTVCENLGFDVDSGLLKSIDPRVVLLDCSDSDIVNTSELKSDAIFGPLFDLRYFARASSRWQIFSCVNDENFQTLLDKYYYFRQQESTLCDAHKAVINPSGESSSSDSRIPQHLIHSVVAVGGTFDHLHAGHKILLTAAALLLQPSDSNQSTLRLVVGITGDILLKNKKYAEYIKSWRQRQEDVVNFLLSIFVLSFEVRKESVETSSLDGPDSNSRAIHIKLATCTIMIECIEINDQYGPTINDESITALVVSRETRSGGSIINQKRIEKCMKPLEVYEIEVVIAKEACSESIDEFASKISSYQIRKRKAENAHFSQLK